MKVHRCEAATDEDGIEQCLEPAEFQIETFLSGRKAWVCADHEDVGGLLVVHPALFMEARK